MANNNLSLDALKSHLFETLEGVKNLNDPKASKADKTSIEQAKQIVDIAKSITDIYKVQVEAFKTFSQMDNVGNLKSMMVGIGVSTEDDMKLIQP